MPNSPHADQFIAVVNSVGDGADGNCIGLDVICTLRATLLPGARGIHFKLPGSGSFILSPRSELPRREHVTINGYTKPWAQPNRLELRNDAVIHIELNGNQLTELSPVYWTATFTGRRSTTEAAGEGDNVEPGNLMRRTSSSRIRAGDRPW